MRHRTLKLYDRLRDLKVEVMPSTPGLLRVYSCGPTVYGRIHVGNARPYWTAMVLKRASERLLDLPVRLAINITDVNDKIYVAARERGVPSAQLAGEIAEAYRSDTDALGLGRPDAEPLASTTIDEIIALIQRLIERGARLRERRRRRLLQRRCLSAVRRAVRSAARRPDRGLARRARRGQASAARFRAVEGHEAGRGHRLGLALGARSPGLAHRVLGDGARTSSARTSTCTAAASI